MKIKKMMKIKKTSISTYIMLFINLSFFYLVDGDMKVFGVSLNDISLILTFLWGTSLWIRLRGLPNPKFEYKFFCIVVPVLCLLSSWQSYRLYSQPFMLGFRAQRTFLFAALLYFPLRKACYYEKISVISLKKVIKAVAITELILFITQYLIGGSFDFLVVAISERYGSSRYYFQPIMIDLLAVMSLDDFLNKKRTENKCWAAVLIILCVFEVMIVQKFRMTTVALLLCLFMGVFISKSSLRRKFLYSLLVLVAVIVLINTTMIQDVLSEIFEGSEKSTLKIRETGRVLYLATLASHPLLGGGYPNKLYPAATVAVGYKMNIYLVDNGVFGLAYIYGGVGIAWILGLWTKMLSIGKRLFDNMKYVQYLLFPIFFLVTSMTEAHWYWMNGFLVLVFFMVMQESELSNARICTSGLRRLPSKTAFG